MTANESAQLAAFRRKVDAIGSAVFIAFCCVLVTCLGTLAVWATYRVIADAPDRNAVCVESSRYSGCQKWEKP